LTTQFVSEIGVSNVQKEELSRAVSRCPHVEDVDVPTALVVLSVGTK